MAPVWSTTLRPDSLIGQPLEKAEHEGVTMRARKSLLGTIVFCRHGATDFHPDRFYDDGDGPNLNAVGLEQAEALARWLSSRYHEVAGIYVSPTVRTRETAAAVARAFGEPGISAPGLAERSMGQWNGRLVEEVKRDDPDGWRAWKSNPLRYAPRDGESLEGFGQRVEAVLADLLGRHPGELMIVVTHVGTIRAALCAALGVPVEHGKRLVIEPGSASRVDYTTGWPNVVYMGVQPT